MTLFPLLLVLYEIAVYLSNDMYIPALPSVAADLLTTNTLAQLTFTLWFLGGLSVQLFLGPLSDRYGRRPILLMGGVVFIISTVICSLAPNVSWLLIGRFIQGAAAPSLMIAGYASIHELLEQKQAIQTLARMQSITILAPSLGPVLGSIFLTMVDWRWIFGVLGVWACLAVMLLYFKMPETLPFEKRQKRIEFGQIMTQYFRLLTNLGFMQNLLAGNLLIGALIAWMLAGPFLVVNKFHESTLYFGIYQTCIFGSFILSTQFVGVLMKKFSLRRLIYAALSLSLIGGVLSLLLALLFPDSILYLVISLIIVAFGSGISFPVLNRIAIEKSEEPMGARMSMATLIQFSAAVLAAIVVSYLNETIISVACMVFICPLLACSIGLIPLDYKKGKN